jgi:hypothetical protein
MSPGERKGRIHRGRFFEHRDRAFKIVQRIEIDSAQIFVISCFHARRVKLQTSAFRGREAQLEPADDFLSNQIVGGQQLPVCDIDDVAPFDIDPALLQAEVGKAFSDSIARNTAAGLRLLRQTEARVQERRVTDAEGIYKVAQAYAVLGDTRAALRVLGQSIDGGFFCFPIFRLILC